MAGTRQVGRRGIARLPMVCAVLAGLFLMHGAPATAADGCHDEPSASMPAVVPASMTGPMPAAMPAPLPAAPPPAESAGSDPGAATAPVRPDLHDVMTSRDGGQVTGAEAVTTAHGATCLSTPARERPALPVHMATAVVAALALAARAGRAEVRGRARRRGAAPPGGRGLLLRVGVARS